MGKKGPRDLSKKTIPQLQNTLWPIFALYIKKNHSEDGEWCNCVTCDKSIQIGTYDCQAGHFLSRSYSATKYSEMNVMPQCGGCNGYGNGKPVEFERRLKLLYGDDAVESLKSESTNKWKWDRFDLIEKINYYKELMA